MTPPALTPPTPRYLGLSMNNDTFRVPKCQETKSSIFWWPRAMGWKEKAVKLSQTSSPVILSVIIGSFGKLGKAELKELNRERSGLTFG